MEKFLNGLQNPKKEITIGLVGKYVSLQDAYKSISESIIHAGAKNCCKINVEWIDSEGVSMKNLSDKLNHLNGLIVAPGFGDRGIDGKILAIKFVRENNIPFLGICLGMQTAVIEFSRNVIGLKNANSTEMDSKTKHPVIDLMNEQKGVKNKGGTMRLGAYECKLKLKTNIYNAYKKINISERHRHRYEFNNSYLEKLEKNGLIASGINQKNNLVEAVEIPNHKWFVGVQFHPEYKSTVDKPHPLFCGFVEACINNK